MASTETQSDQNSTEINQESAGLEQVLGSADHKNVGRMFIWAGLVGLIGGLIVGLAAAAEAMDLGGFTFVADANEFTQLWSLGRDLAMFGGVVPILVGIGLYIVPLQVGAPSIAFPRGAAGAFWTWLLGIELVIASYIFEGGPGGLNADFVVLWAASLAMALGGLVWALICIASTVLGVRTVGMRLERVPQTSWAYLVFSLVGMLSLPVVMAELLLAYLRVRHGHMSTEAGEGVSVLASESLTAVMDGVSFAPAIYWLGIPLLGIAADVVAVHTGRALTFHRAIMGAIGLFGILAFGVDLVGLASVRSIDFRNGLLVLGLIAAAVPVLASLALIGESIGKGELKLRTPLLAALASGLLLLAGTVVSFLGLVEAIMGYIAGVQDTQPDAAIIGPLVGFLAGLLPDVSMENTLVLNGTTFHEGIRALLIGAALMSVVGAIHHWGANLFGRRLAEPLGTLTILLTAAGSVVWAIGEIAAGYADQPQLPASELGDRSGVEAFNSIAALGVAVLAAGAVVLAANMAMTNLGKPAGSSPNQWRGSTLEWATAMPPGPGNFPALPVVASATPLADGELVYVSDDDADSDNEDSAETEKVPALTAGGGDAATGAEE